MQPATLPFRSCRAKSRSLAQVPRRRSTRTVARRDHPSGYALVAAVASIAVFAAMALAMLTATRAAVVTGVAEVGQARAAAAADAGIALALAGLVTSDPGARWRIDGSTRKVEFAGAQLVIRVDDERGKVPLNLMDPPMATRLLDAFGLEGEARDIARDSLLDWLDADDERRPHGAEDAFYAPLGYRPRNGAMASVGELRRVRGFDPALVTRMMPLLTVNFGRGNFEPSHATPRAIEIMMGDEGAADLIDRRRELAGQRTAIDLTPDSELVAHPLMITSMASTPDGARAVRRQVIELTGAAVRPYVVRSYD